jgi:hypothetical protein
MPEDAVMVELQEDFYPRGARNGTLVWGRYTIDALLDGAMTPGESIEMFSLFFTAQSEHRFYVYPCGFARRVAEFNIEEYSDSYGLIGDAYYWSMLVYQEMDTATRRRIFKQLTDDADTAGDPGYYYVKSIPQSIGQLAGGIDDRQLNHDADRGDD